MDYRLALDLGTNSLGWAVYEMLGQNAAPSMTGLSLINGGVMIFSDGRNPKSKASNAVERREPRGARRNRDRTIKRRKRLLRALIKHGLMPEDEKGRDAFFKQNPYQMRSEALDRLLTPYELGRAFWGLHQRRGFQSNRKSKSTEDGAVALGIQTLESRMRDAKARSLGEYQWGLAKGYARVKASESKDIYPSRKMLWDELALIEEAQKAHGSPIASQAFEDIHDILTYQRPLRPVERGQCAQNIEEKRAFRAYPIFQQWRIYQEVSNLRLEYPDDDGVVHQRRLTPEEIQKLALHLLGSSKIELEKVPAKLGLSPEFRVKSQGNRKALNGDEVGVKMRNAKAFGKKAWGQLTLDQKQDLIERLMDWPEHRAMGIEMDEESDQAIHRFLMAEYALSSDQAHFVLNAPLPEGTASYGKRALLDTLILMRDGSHDLYQAKQIAFAHADARLSGASLDHLPYYGQVLTSHVLGAKPAGAGNDVERFGRLTSPTVHIGLNQVRRLVNFLIDKYGSKPQEILVELARDLKMTKTQKDEAAKRNKQNETRNQELKKMILDSNRQPTAALMYKMQIWEEMGPLEARVCPYTGTVLSATLVMSEHTEVEHILPFSRSLDDSRSNKIISMRHANREKRNFSPAECWQYQDPGRYADILARVSSLPRAKQWRFQPNAMERYAEDQGFLDRQLNETKYLARMARLYLQVLYPDDTMRDQCVRVVPGQMTGLVRKVWDLDSELNKDDQTGKNRTDHRHHFIDAAIVGLTTTSLLQAIQKQANAKAQDHEDLYNARKLIAGLTPPYNAFRDELRRCLDNMTVWHRPDHFRYKPGQTTGSLHNDTAYGITGQRDEKGLVILTERKRLADMDSEQLDSIRDEGIKAKLVALLQQVRSENPDLFKDLKSTATQKEKDKIIWPIFLKRVEAMTKVRNPDGSERPDSGLKRVKCLLNASETSLAFIKDKTGRSKYRMQGRSILKAFKTDGNAFMDVWRLPNGKTKGETVSRFDAHQPQWRSHIQSAFPTAKKLMRLHTGDNVAVGSGEERTIFQVRGLTGQRIILYPNQAVYSRDRERKNHDHYLPVKYLSAGKVLSENLRKVSVMPDGSIKDRGVWPKPAKDA